MPKVSVIIPNYRHARFLPKRISSVLGQTFTDIEVLFLDDASPDDSVAVYRQLAGDPRMRAIFNPANSGSTFKQWARGIAETSGEYIWLAESDDFASPQLLERLVAVMEAHPLLGIAYCQSTVVDENDKPQGILPLYVPYPNPQRWGSDFVAGGREEIASYFLWGCPIQNASAALIRRSVYERAGGVDTSMKLAGDWKLYVKLLVHSDVAFIAEPMNFFRRHAATVRSASRRDGVDIADAYLMLELVESLVSIPPGDSNRRRRQLVQWWATAARGDLTPAGKDRIVAIAARVDPAYWVRYVLATAEIALRDIARTVRGAVRS